MDLIYTRNCVADNILIKPLHTSDHYFIAFNLHLATSEPPTPLPVTFRRNLFFPFTLTSFLFPSATRFSVLDVNVATDTLFSTLTSCLDHICPPGQYVLRLLTPGYLMFFVNIGPNSGKQRENGQIKQSPRPKYLSVFAFIFLCWSPYCQGLILPQQDQQYIRHTLQNIQPPPPPPPSLTADDFATFFTNKTRSISSQFHTCRNSNQPHLLLKLPSSHSVPSLRQKYPNFSSPATLQHTLLIQSPHTFSMQSLLHSYQHAHTSSTHLSLQAPSPLHSSRLGLPHCSKNLH